MGRVAAPSNSWQMKMFTFIADYEDLGFNLVEAQALGIAPGYLSNKLAAESKIPGHAVIPLHFSAVELSGDNLYSTDCWIEPVTFTAYLDYLINKYPLKKKNTRIMFHNLAHDGSIILTEVRQNGWQEYLQLGFTQISPEYTSTEEYWIFNRGCGLENYKGYSIIGRKSMPMAIELAYRGYKFYIGDTFSTFPQSQDSLLKDAGYELKTPVEWHTINLENLKRNRKLIKARCDNDVISMAAVYRGFLGAVDELFSAKGVTSASIAMNGFKNWLKTKRGDGSANDAYREKFPILTEKAYRLSAGCYTGGVAQINPKYRGKVINDVYSYDIVSSYPTAMTLPLPCGEPEDKFWDFNEEKYADIAAYIEFDFRNTGVIPFLRCHKEGEAAMLSGRIVKLHNYKRKDFPMAYKGYIMLNSIDYITAARVGAIKNFTIVKSMVYNMRPVFKDFILMAYELKNGTTGFKKKAAKVILNSLYGKHAQNLSGFTPFDMRPKIFGKEYAVGYNVHDTDKMYMPVAAATTAYGRRTLINGIKSVGLDAWIYSDTDSIYIRGSDFGTLDISGNLGGWSRELLGASFKGFGPKCYAIKLKDGGHKIVCAGLGALGKSRLTFASFNENAIVKQLKSVSIHGGKMLLETDFTIKPRGGINE